MDLPDEASTIRLGEALARACDLATQSASPAGWAPARRRWRARSSGRSRPEEEVPSPTFTLVQTYDGRDFPLAHFDLYRLESAGEALELGLDEALDTGAAIIEWPERLGVPPRWTDST
jgi:tRNA threonylcarbamoyladenosine biosynthesis protein TsaE